MLELVGDALVHTLGCVIVGLGRAVRGLEVPADGRDAAHLLAAHLPVADGVVARVVDRLRQRCQLDVVDALHASSRHHATGDGLAQLELRYHLTQLAGVRLALGPQLAQLCDAALYVGLSLLGLVLLDAPRRAGA